MKILTGIKITLEVTRNGKVEDDTTFYTKYTSNLSIYALKCKFKFHTVLMTVSQRQTERKTKVVFFSPCSCQGK